MQVLKALGLVEGGSEPKSAAKSPKAPKPSKAWDGAPKKKEVSREDAMEHARHALEHLALPYKAASGVTITRCDPQLQITLDNGKVGTFGIVLGTRVPSFPALSARGASSVGRLTCFGVVLARQDNAWDLNHSRVDYEVRIQGTTPVSHEVMFHVMFLTRSQIAAWAASTPGQPTAPDSTSSRSG